jgi:hypothetical protein
MRLDLGDRAAETVLMLLREREPSSGGEALNAV